VAALLRATLEATSEGILVVDLAGRISAYNRKFLSLMGIPEYVMAPMELDEVVQYLTDQVGDPATLLDEARLLRSRSDKETQGILPLVGDRILEKTGRPHKVGGEMVGRVLSFREPQAREAPGTLLKAIGNARQAYSEATLATRVVPWYLVEDRLVVPDNGADILGITPPPSDLRGLVDHMHPEDAQFLMEALEQGQNVSFKARLRQPDGSWRWLRWNLDRGPEGYRGVFMDITEQVWLQERACQRKRAEGARDLSRRLAGRLHDQLRTTLTDLQGRDPGLAEALQPLQEMDGLLARMRAFAQLGRPTLALVQPNALVGDLLPRARAEAGPGVQIQFKPGVDLPGLYLDPAQMEVALLELLRNAWQASGPTGALQVGTGLLGSRAPRPGGLPGSPRPRVSFEVRDLGPGIPPGLHRQIFEPFFTTHAEPGRAGLGLAMVQAISEGHAGSVQVESAPGKGTVVRILLPV
jgi:signal transduction histidine kinase